MAEAQWLMLRGLMRERRHWEGFDEVLAAHLPESRVHTLDLPGNGRLNQEASPPRIEGMVEHLRRQLEARRLEPPFRVAALSLGAMVTLDWLTRYPNEIAGAVLMNTSLRGYSPFYQRLRPSSYLPLLRGFWFTEDADERERTIVDLTSNLRADKYAVAARWAGYARERPVSKANIRAQIEAAARFEPPRTLPAVPTLVMRGAGDRLVSPRCSLELSKQWNLPLETHPEAGHDITLDAGAWVARKIRDWSARVLPHADREPLLASSS